MPGRIQPHDDRAAAGARRNHRPRQAASPTRHAHLSGRMHPLGASGRTGHRDGRRANHQHQAGPRGRIRRSQARARCRAGGGHSGMVRRHARIGHRTRAQHRARDAAELHASGRCLGQQALLGARHHSSARGSNAARNHRRSRRARLRLRTRPRFSRFHHRPAGNHLDRCPISFNC